MKINATAGTLGFDPETGNGRGNGRSAAPVRPSLGARQQARMRRLHGPRARRKPLAPRPHRGGAGAAERRGGEPGARANRPARRAASAARQVTGGRRRVPLDERLAYVDDCLPRAERLALEETMREDAELKREIANWFT